MTDRLRLYLNNSAFQFHAVHKFVSVSLETSVVAEEQVGTLVAAAELTVIGFSHIVEAYDSSFETSQSKAFFKVAFSENGTVHIDRTYYSTGSACKACFISAVFEDRP